MNVWLEASRPRTLGAALAPVVMGAAIAHTEGGIHPGALAAAAVGAMLIQIGTNFANDAFDFLKGADTAERVGPARATAQGKVSARAMLVATAVVFGLATLVGVYLAIRGGWPIVVIGLCSIASGVLYTGGPRPLAYVGLGDVFVLVFFGPVAVAGTVYVQTLAWSPAAVVAGLAPGALATAILAVNNLRDRHTDAPAGKRTLAVRFGPTFARLEWAACAAVAGAVPLVLITTRPGGLLALLTAPLALVVGRGVWRHDGAALNPYLGRTAGLLTAYCVLFALGWAWP